MAQDQTELSDNVSIVRAPKFGDIVAFRHMDRRIVPAVIKATGRTGGLYPNVQLHVLHNGGFDEIGVSYDQERIGCWCWPTEVVDDLR